MSKNTTQESESDLQESEPNIVEESQQNDTAAELKTPPEGTESRMHPDIAGDWPLWSRVVATTAVARLAKVHERFSDMTAAVLATADGMHIASLGVEEEVGDRLAAMNASLFGVARAEAEVISGGGIPSLSAVVSVTIGDRQTALLSFVLEPFGQLLLSISAKDVQLGTVIVQARQAAADLVVALGRAAPKAPEAE